jgi:hypothetical protein
MEAEVKVFLAGMVTIAFLLTVVTIAEAYVKTHRPPAATAKCELDQTEEDQ